ncbi:MAG: hypothetical protein AAFV80_06265 [Bacteroidota bacterium]
MAIRRFATLLVFGCFVFWITSCSEETVTLDFDYGYDYFPQEVGKFIIYQVDSIIYDQQPQGTVIDTNSIQVREEFVESFIDNSGATIYRIERSERRDANSPWVVRDVWSSSQNETQAIRTEENLRFIKMIYPALESTDPWDGNAFIDNNTIISVAGESITIFKNWLYQYEAAGIPFTVSGVPFDSTLNVIQANEENLIELRYSKEVYAKDIGMVYREMMILDTQCIAACEGLSWEQKAEKGFILKQRIIDTNW